MDSQHGQNSSNASSATPITSNNHIQDTKTDLDHQDIINNQLFINSSKVSSPSSLLSSSSSNSSYENQIEASVQLTKTYSKMNKSSLSLLSLSSTSSPGTSSSSFISSPIKVPHFSNNLNSTIEFNNSSLYSPIKKMKTSKLEDFDEYNEENSKKQAKFVKDPIGDEIRKLEQN